MDANEPNVRRNKESTGLCYLYFFVPPFFQFTSNKIFIQKKRKNPIEKFPTKFTKKTKNLLRKNAGKFVLEKFGKNSF